MFRPDPSDPTPLYLQIAETLRRSIALGQARPGERLPTVRELAARAQVNRNTAARAVRQLEREGLVRTRAGGGTYVAPATPAVRPPVDPANLERLLDRAVLEAHTTGVPLEELGWRLSRRIDAFRRQRRAAELRDPEL